MQIARPTRCLLIYFGLTLFFLTISTEAMARGGGPGGGGGGGYGGGYSGGVRGGPPGAYRMRRVYNNDMSGSASEGRSPSQPRSQSMPRPTTGTRPQPAQQQSPQTRRHPAVSPEGRYDNYGSITEKYEKLRETRHQEYWERQNRQP
jgi:hypothetical protein